MEVDRAVVSGVAIGLGIVPELIGTSYVYTEAQAARIVAKLREHRLPRPGRRRRRAPRAVPA